MRHDPLSIIKATTVSNLQSIGTTLQRHTIYSPRSRSRGKTTAKSERTSAVKIDFFAGDDGLKLIRDDSDESGVSGTFEGKEVVLSHVNEDEMRVGGRSSRHVEIYKRLGARPVVLWYM